MAIKSNIKGPKKRLKKQSFNKSYKIAIDTGVPFIDNEFKADDSVISITSNFRSKLSVGKIVWKRPREITSDPKFLFKDKLGSATDINFLGNGPNQWLIAAAFAISQDKQLVYKLLPKEQYHFLRGIFKACLWQCGVWYKITIDDKLPTFNNELIFSSSKCKTVFWVPLLEKAYAKLYGNYENMSTKGSLKDALTHFTGAPTEHVIITDQDDEKDLFRLIAEELDKKSLLCLQTRDNLSHDVNLKNKRIYLIKNVKKPSTGSFKKNIKETSATIHLVNTIYDEERKRGSNNYYFEDKFDEQLIKVDNFTKIFESLTICRLHLNENKHCISLKTVVNSQLCFDIAQDNDEVMIDFHQDTDEPKDIGFEIYRVESNRQFKVHNFTMNHLAFSSTTTKSTIIFQRIKLNYGRYVLLPNCCDTDLKVLIRLYTSKPSNFRVLKFDMPRRNFFTFRSLKYPKFVSRIVIKGAHGLEKQDRFGSANPYCIIRCGRHAIKSYPVQDSLNPDFNDFSAIFYHDKFATLSVELWNRSFLLDTLIGKVDIQPMLNDSEATSLKEIDLISKKKVEKLIGSLKYSILTSEDLRSF